MTIDTERLKTDAAYWDELAIPVVANWAAIKNASLVGWAKYPMGDESIINLEMIPRPTKPAEPEWNENTAAIKTLRAIGYTWNGGQEWKPPLGEEPEWLDWNGAGLPPVGCDCCMSHKYNDSLDDVEVKIVCYTRQLVIVANDVGTEYAMDKLSVLFRPLRTPEQRQREELSEVVAHASVLKGGTILEEWQYDCIADAVMKFYEERYNLEPKP